MATLTNSAVAERGRSRFDLQLRATGNSQRDLMASLNGFVLVSVGEGRIQTSVVDRLGAGLLAEIASLVNPMSRRNDYADVECAVVLVEVHHGVASTEGCIALETRKTNFTVTGG